MFKLLKVKSWLKNLLILVPLVLDPTVYSVCTFFQALVAIIGWSFMASTIYIINDIIDLSDDRRHPIKKFRSIASGDVSVQKALLVAALLLIGSSFVSISLGLNFFFCTYFYLFLNVIYSARLKKAKYLDILLLSYFFILRLQAGAIVTGTILSYWLILMAIFVFLSIAADKRYKEMVIFDRISEARGYTEKDIKFLGSLRVLLLFMALLFFNLFLFLTLKTDSSIVLIIVNYFLIYIGIIFLNDLKTDDPVSFIFNNYWISIVLFILLAFIVMQKLNII
jgi:4-hydroxybenzoate polyprenyltransferase